MDKMHEHLNRSSSLRVGLGSFVAIEAQARTAKIAQLGMAAAFDAVARVDALMHPTRAGSDLAALKASSPQARSNIHPWTFEVLKLCQQLNRLSHGIFDPCLPESDGRITDLELMEPCGVKLHRPVLIDLGGIAKGYAVDRALAALRAAGCLIGLVNAGGDLAVFGATSHQIVCRDEEGGAVLVELKDAALASTDTEADARPCEHRGYYHGADPCAAVRGNISVVARTAAIADALTKCLLFGEPDLNARLLKHFNARRIER